MTQLSPKARQDALLELEEAVRQLEKIKCENSFAEFVKAAWILVEPETPLLWNWHVDTICEYLQATYDRRIKRLIINVPPGSLKSILVSVLFPAWVWTKDSAERFLGITNEEGLATRDAVRSKNVVMSEWYQKNWPIELKRDVNQKTLYENEDTGFRQAIGITANITGKRGTFQLIDDPHDATGAQSDLKRQGVIDTYDQKLSTRLNNQETDRIILIMQRLHHLDLTGHMLKKKNTQWVHLVIPMEFDPAIATFDPVKDLGALLPEAEARKKYARLADPRKKKGELFFKELFSANTVKVLKEDMGEFISAGQLQQQPSPKGGGILKSKWFNLWEDFKKIKLPNNEIVKKKNPFPVCSHIFFSYDTAYSEEDLKNNSYSAVSQWGVFFNHKTQKDNILLLSTWAGQVDYPVLRKKAMMFENKFHPDCHLIEKKASGQSLVQDLRAAGIPFRTYNPDRDKVARAYSIQSMLERGMVWIPDRQWAHKFVGYLATFPTGEPISNDYTDTFTQAMIYLRSGSYVEPLTDAEEAEYDKHGEKTDDDEEAYSAYG